MSRLFDLLEIKKPSCDGQFMFSDGGGGGIEKTTSAIKLNRPFSPMKSSTNPQ